jgi:Tol biopolymer transport system component
MAYVRRLRSKTALELMDVATGRVRSLTEDLERDNQEGFAFHGVFPGFSWTPDGGSIVATSEGKIWKWDVSSGKRTAVPFEARVDQRVTEAARFARRLSDPTIRARILRWPVESPDGKRLVFSAAGHLHGMDLPSGKPARLTTLETPEYAPALSHDGKLLTFVTWDDKTGGFVWSAAFGPDGLGPPKQLTDLPAQYANPSFSRDGSKIVFLKGSGATFRDDDLAGELWHEIHWVSSAGGPSHYVIGTKNRGQNRRMARPMFSADGDRIYYVEDEPAAKPASPPKTVLVSVKLDGTDRRAHLRFTRAEEAAVSPDGRWVVFNEQHNAWVTALPEVGSQTVEVGLEKSALPLAQLTDEGGEWVGWADGGKALTWIFGSAYHRLALEKAFPPPTAAEVEAAKGTPKAKKGKDGDSDTTRRPKRKRRRSCPSPSRSRSSSTCPERSRAESSRTRARGS